MVKGEKDTDAERYIRLLMKTTVESPSMIDLEQNRKRYTWKQTKTDIETK